MHGARLLSTTNMIAYLSRCTKRSPAAFGAIQQSFQHSIRQPQATMTTTTTTATAKLQRLHALRATYIEQWSTHSFKMEYDGYLSNHLLHALTALTDLGADEKQVQEYANRYVEKLCVVEDRALDDLAPSVLIADAAALRGKRENFEGLRAMYESEINHITADGAITEHLPNLVGGLAGSLLHGIIQLGYAYHVGGDLLIAEGLAYLHFSYLSFEVPKGEVDVMGVTPFTREAAFALAQAVQKDTSLLQTMRENMKRPVFANVVQGNLQRRLMSFSSDPIVGSPVLFNAVRSAVDQFDLEDVNGATALDFVLWLYVVSPQNDFVLLHAATSAWSIQQVEHLLAVDDKRRAWKTWFRMALGGFIMDEVPQLPSVDPTAGVDAAAIAALPSWDDLYQKALALEGDVDEHVYKMVQVAREMDAADEQQSSFLTPTQRTFVTKSAALKALTNDFFAAPSEDPMLNL